MTYYFITFTRRLERDKAKQLLAEIRKQIPGKALFVPRPPRGRKMILNIMDEVVIITFPPKQDQGSKQDQGQQGQQDQGFKLGEILKGSSKSKKA